MASLVTLQQLKGHLKLPDLGSPDPREEDLEIKLDAAEEIVLGHIARTDDEDWTAAIAAWTEETVPRRIKVAILMQAADLYRFRGDDAPADQRKAEEGFLAPDVRRLLVPFRDPTLR